ncbi:siderophore-interacting protein [Paracoccus lutimaris]|uniref:NADPH-dependent ferric siderophore reductase n=1 Tax=Paracoccus lutimaris TaxID=1490030 RepID=A0A368Z9F2_9RHOB|nr:siderophore-interacting protein [Paracoccus lutimaris]RCW87094.1 NADPH-dependent ferric siderophore reductase [Paracoccus lutimaris]
MPNDDTTNRIAAPRIQRVKYEIRRREPVIAEVAHLTPHMIRVTLRGDELADFESAAADDHIKVLVPGPDGALEARDYTPRAFDTARRELVIDFVDHGDGPASGWARKARAGETLKIAGPRGSRVISGTVPNWIFVGDETALPAIGRFLEELPAGTRATVIAAVPGPADEQKLESAADLDLRWIHRPLAEAADPAPLLGALRPLRPAPGTFVWIAAEAAVARALRQHVLGLGHPPGWIRAAGYWVRGQADASDKEILD